MRKNGKRGKVIAVAAAGALVVLLASTIARCAAAGNLISLFFYNLMSQLIDLTPT